MGEKAVVTNNNNAEAHNKNNGAKRIDPRTCLERYYIDTTNIPKEYLTGIYYLILAYTLGDLYDVIIPTKLTGDKDPIRTNLWIVFAGRSGEGKSQAIDIIRETIRSIEILSSVAEKILEGLTSEPEIDGSEPTVEEIRETVNKAKKRFMAMRLVLGSREGFARHISENFTETNGKFLVELDEIRTLLQGKKGYIEELMDLLLTIYMGKPYKLTYSTREYEIPEHSYICLIGGAQLLEENFDLYLFDRGFYRRAIIIYGEKQDKDLIPSLNLEYMKDLVALIIAIAVKRVFAKYMWEKIREKYRSLKRYRMIRVNLTDELKLFNNLLNKYGEYNEEAIGIIIKYIEELQDKLSRAEDPKIQKILEANSVHVLRLWVLNAIAESFPPLSWIIEKARSVLDKYVNNIIEEYSEIFGDEWVKGHVEGKEYPEDWAKDGLKKILDGKLEKEEINLLTEIVEETHKMVSEFFNKLKPAGALESLRFGFANTSTATKTIGDMKTIYQNEVALMEKVFANPDENELIVRKIGEKIMRLIRENNNVQGLGISEIYRHFSGKKRRYIKEALKRLWEEEMIVFVKAQESNGRPAIKIFPADTEDKLPAGAIMSEGEVITLLGR